MLDKHSSDISVARVYSHYRGGGRGRRKKELKIVDGEEMVDRRSVSDVFVLFEKQWRECV